MKKTIYIILLFTEKKIKDELIDLTQNSNKYDKIYIAIFYLSEKDIIKELINASNRGGEIEIILDPNKDAFGYKKNDIPNRSVANELIKNQREI